MDILKEQALTKLVSILVNDHYASPGSGHIFSEEIANLLKEIQNDR